MGVIVGLMVFSVGDFVGLVGVREGDLLGVVVGLLVGSAVMVVPSCADGGALVVVARGRGRVVPRAVERVL